MTCTNCHSELPLRVCRSAAGYYVGRFCDNCGPHGRDSGYFADEVEATDALLTYHPHRRRRRMVWVKP